MRHDSNVWQASGPLLLLGSIRVFEALVISPTKFPTSSIRGLGSIGRSRGGRATRQADGAFSVRFFTCLFDHWLLGPEDEAAGLVGRRYLFVDGRVVSAGALRAEERMVEVRPVGSGATAVIGVDARVEEFGGGVRCVKVGSHADVEGEAVEAGVRFRSRVVRVGALEPGRRDAVDGARVPEEEVAGLGEDEDGRVDGVCGGVREGKMELGIATRGVRVAHGGVGPVGPRDDDESAAGGRRLGRTRVIRLYFNVIW